MNTLKELTTNITNLQSVSNTNLNYLNNLSTSMENFYDEMADDLIYEIRISLYAMDSIVEGIKKVYDISSKELPIFLEEPNTLMVEIWGLVVEVKYTLYDIMTLCIIYSAMEETARQLQEGGRVEGSIVDDVSSGVGVLDEFITRIETLNLILSNYNSMMKGGIL